LHSFFRVAISVGMDRGVAYSSARKRIRDGDVLLFRRGDGIVSKMIAVAGRSPYIHAGMAVWWHDRLMCVETIQGIGGRAAHLSAQVTAPHTTILVRRVRSRKFNRPAAADAMLNVIGKRYGWWGLFKAATIHLPIWRFLVKPDTDDKANGSLPFCSQAVASALRAGGVDPVPNLADRLTEPGDLARSAALRDVFILTSG